MPHGDRLILSATDHPQSDVEPHRIVGLDVADGSLHEIAAPGRPFGDMHVSLDGLILAYVASPGDGPMPHDLFLMTLAGVSIRNATSENLDRPILALRWRPDGTLLALTEDGFKRRLVILSQNAAPQPFGSFNVNPTGFDVTKSGAVVFVGHSATQPDELWLWDGKRPAERVSKLNDNWSRFQLVRPEIVRFKSFDGLEIEGALLKPTGYDGKSKLPLIVLVHGGPTGAWSDSIDSWGQLLVERGYAIFYPNIRGSSGYGHKFLAMNRGDWGGGDFQDLMAGVDYLVAQGIADPNRLGIGGWSYGGYMAEWAITQTDRFKASVCGAGLSNLASEFGTESGPSYDKWFYGVPYENMQGFLKSSPITYIKNAKTPTLILQGEDDSTDPIGQSQELFRGLKYYGVTTELILYPREGHGLLEEKHQLDRLNRILAWYDLYLK